MLHFHDFFFPTMVFHCKFKVSIHDYHTHDREKNLVKVGWGYCSKIVHVFSSGFDPAPRVYTCKARKHLV